eukprot:CAMPEP_0202918468 /NCGR_PEP_ID=MMETSP1392-20130828/73542_1 /ASSEMBLY_ACC=CAM_ASM_000868 /TAXON_ID=225041 /ORGANISM="Chlamydomonas chlamydogama, Strain SAG 11-48b" /LENGTH=56 /DNA_ID=CAMNT_0049611541 /DNA_START=371 /DNA_END=537 /DNA_ORIENTATION=+
MTWNGFALASLKARDTWRMYAPVAHHSTCTSQCCGQSQSVEGGASMEWECGQKYAG